MPVTRGINKSAFRSPRNRMTLFVPMITKKREIKLVVTVLLNKKRESSPIV